MHLKLSPTSTGDITSTAASAADAIRARFSSHCPVRITIEQAMCIGICAKISHSLPVVEFIFDRIVSRVSCSKMSSFELNSGEWCAIIARCCGSHANESMLKLSASRDFVQRVHEIETTLQCTLSEGTNKRAWKSIQTQVAVVLCFQTIDPPYPALDAVFGSVVRSDLRRCEDFHSSQQEESMDIITLATIVESVAHAVLS